MEVSSGPVSHSIVLDHSHDGHLAIDEEQLSSTIQQDEVKLKLLAAPINPLDIAVMNGVYPTKPQHYNNGRAIPGYDGLAEVIELGSGVEDLSAGDLVIPSKHGLGTWRSYAVVKRSWVDRIPKPDDIQFGAIVKGSVMPAYFLVEDVVRLRPGDCIILNAATSVIAQYVTQFARLKGVQVISVVRDRPNSFRQKVNAALLAMGSRKVLVECELEEPRVLAELKSLRIVMAIDSVFGSAGGELVKCLAPGGKYIQLGFLGGVATTISVGTQDLFLRGISMQAFRGTTQLGQRSELERSQLLNWLVDAFNTRLLRLPALGLTSVQWDHSDPVKTLERIFEATSQAKTATLGQRKQIILMQ